METVDSVTRTILRTIPDSLALMEVQLHIILVVLVLMVHMAVQYLHTIPDSLVHTEAQPHIILVVLVQMVHMVVQYLHIIPDSLAHIMVDSPVPTVSLAKCLEPLPELMKVPKLLS